MVTQDDIMTDRGLEWLTRVAGVDEDYIARWSRAEWAEWSCAMRADPAEECPCVPKWMRPHMPVWSGDFSLPFPTVAHLWATSHDWFSEAETHSDLTLTIEEPAEGWYPQLEHVRAAWQYAASRGAAPRLSITVVPGNPVGHAVVGLVEAFLLIGPTDEDIILELHKIFGVAPTTSMTDPTEGVAHAWNWM